MISVYRINKCYDITLVGWIVGNYVGYGGVKSDSPHPHTLLVFGRS